MTTVTDLHRRISEAHQPVCPNFLLFMQCSGNFGTIGTHPTPWEIIFTARKRSLGQGNIFSSVCQEFCLEGSASVHAGIPLVADTPPSRSIPLRRRHPLGTRHPPPQCMLGDTVNKQVVCILLECNLVTGQERLIRTWLIRSST